MKRIVFTVYRELYLDRSSLHLQYNSPLDLECCDVFLDCNLIYVRLVLVLIFLVLLHCRTRIDVFVHRCCVFTITQTHLVAAAAAVTPASVVHSAGCLIVLRSSPGGPLVRGLGVLRLDNSRQAAYRHHHLSCRYAGGVKAAVRVCPCPCRCREVGFVQSGKACCAADSAVASDAFACVFAFRVAASTAGGAVVRSRGRAGRGWEVR